MALIICPECGGQVSDSCTSCPHCGYSLRKNLFSNNNGNINRNGYDVMLVDYSGSELLAATHLKNILECNYMQARNVLRNLPAYLYNDITQQEADYIGIKLQNNNMRIAIYDPNGRITYYTPYNYNKPEPLLSWLFSVPRIPTFSVFPTTMKQYPRERRIVSSPATYYQNNKPNTVYNGPYNTNKRPGKSNINHKPANVFDNKPNGIFNNTNRKGNTQNNPSATNSGLVGKSESGLGKSSENNKHESKLHEKLENKN